MPKLVYDICHKSTNRLSTNLPVPVFMTTLSNSNFHHLRRRRRLLKTIESKTKFFEPNFYPFSILMELLKKLVVWHNPTLLKAMLCFKKVTLTRPAFDALFVPLPILVNVAGNNCYNNFADLN